MNGDQGRHPKMASNEDDSLAVGIDLGTTYSCVSIFENGKSKVIPNEYGNRITPSVVSFSADGILVGDDGKRRLVLDPQNTVYEIKRIIGRDFTDPIVSRDAQLWPFGIEEKNGKPVVCIEHQGETKTFSPEQISALILGKMKEIAEDYLNKKVTRAVITVPAYFNDSQRTCTIDAAQIAGLEVLRIINEPTAAALAYHLLAKSDRERNILVFDLGGGTFDVSILNQDEGISRVMATDGDTHLGGSDFDNRMVNDLITWFNKTHVEDALSDVRRKEFHRLRRACEIAKCEVSEKVASVVNVLKFHADKDLEYHFERSKFEDENDDLFQQVIAKVHEALRAAHLRPDEIDDVLLVGGSSRIPKIRAYLQEVFVGKTLNTSINPDEVVACGAAVQAAILEGVDDLDDMVLYDVTPLSLGINVHGEMTATVIAKNAAIPCRGKKTLTTTEDFQTLIDMGVYQGEHDQTEQNHHLGEFLIDDITPQEQGVPRIDVTFDIDVNGIITASAKERNSENQRTYQIQSNSAPNSKAEIREQARGQASLGEDRAEKSRVNLREELVGLVERAASVVRTQAEELGLGQEESRRVLAETDRVERWLVDNPHAALAEFREQLEGLRRACDQIPPDLLEEEVPDVD